MSVDNPGPGSYDPRTNINQDGLYFVSTMKSSVTRKFGNPPPKRSHTKNFSMNSQDLNRNQFETPGPGSYRVNSEFGLYNLQNDNEREKKYRSNGCSTPTSVHKKRPKTSSAMNRSPPRLN
jgi:hypothetical protein